MRGEYDREADALYIWLRELPYGFGVDLDHARHIDYAIDRLPTGIELFNVSMGVNLDDLPERSGLERLLLDRDIRVLARS